MEQEFLPLVLRALFVTSRLHIALVPQSADERTLEEAGYHMAFFKQDFVVIRT